MNKKSIRKTEVNDKKSVADNKSDLEAEMLQENKSS